MVGRFPAVGNDPHLLTLRAAGRRIRAALARKKTRRLPRQSRERSSRTREENTLQRYLPALVAAAVVLLGLLVAVICAKGGPEKKRKRPRKVRVDYSAKWYSEGYKRGAEWIRRCPDKGASEAQLREIADLMTSDYYKEMAREYEGDFIDGFMKATTGKR